MEALAKLTRLNGKLITLVAILWRGIRDLAPSLHQPVYMLERPGGIGTSALSPAMNALLKLSEGLRRMLEGIARHPAGCLWSWRR